MQDTYCNGTGSVGVWDFGMEVRMRERDMIERLQREIVIPDIVQAKADQTFQKIQKENRKELTMRTGRKKWKTVWAVVAAAVLALGMTVCAAVYRYGSKGLEAELMMTPEQKRFLEEKEYMTPIVDETGSHTGVTCQGVTITPMYMIVDQRFAWISFQVEGFAPEEGKEPGIYLQHIVIDGDEYAPVQGYGGFYDGLRYTGDGFVRDDGASAYDADGNLCPQYVDEEGRLEYVIEIVGTDYEKGLIDASLYVEFEGLGTMDKAEFFSEVEGVWAFDLELKGSEAVRKTTLSAPLGDSGAILDYAEISPISVYVTGDFPLQMEEMEAVNGQGGSMLTETFVHAPDFVGLRMKDGSLLTYIINGGTVGYLDAGEEVYRWAYGITPTVDPQEVDALLFEKSAPEANAQGIYQYKEDDMYIVPLK